MDQVNDMLRRAWLHLALAGDLAAARANGPADEWMFVAAELSRARWAVEAVGAASLLPAGTEELPTGSCHDLARAAVAALLDIPWEDEPPGVTLALLAATDALRAVERRPAA